MRRYPAVLACLLALLGIPSLLTGGCAKERVKPPRLHKIDVIYGRKDGMALTMDVFLPRHNANGAGIVWVVSGGWFSAHEAIDTKLSRAMIDVLVRRGYTVFAVVHGSMPRYTIPDITRDLNRAVRYIRYNAADYKIVPDRIGIAGASSGGHLALMQAMAGDYGNPEAKDKIDQTSSRVQAAACFFPPTDFLNYGQTGESGLGEGRLKGYAAAFAFPLAVPSKKQEFGRLISPINHVTMDDPPTLLIHGDSDPLVPIQQSEIMLAKLKAAGVTAELHVKQGGGHGWQGIEKDMPQVADWFDRYLLHK